MGPTRQNGRNDARARGGFTLAEALLASTILAIVAATATLPFTAGVQQVNEAAKLEQAVALGQAMMEEILARPFFEPDERIASPGPGPDETSRELFNNIDDFDGYAESVGDLRNFENAVITDPSSDGFWRDVSVDYVSFPGLGQAGDDVNSFVHIRVRVYHNNALLVTLDRVASRED
ncbi:MAG: type II secretion system protein [Phycisphaerae bacterium]|nr:type II secretion system protein [Phycisphaerae bacterium]